jgi:hypothetical protein
MAMRIAMVLVLASACSGTITTGNGDDDDAPPPPPVTDVQLTVHDGATPEAGVAVVFQASDGTLIAEAITDSAGLAKADMPNGGYVTVIRTYPPTVNGTVPDGVYTYVGVKAGDRLQLGHPVDDLTSPTAIVVKVPDAAQGTVTVSTPCGSGQGTAPNIPITISGCPADVTFFVEDGNRSSFVAHSAIAPNVDFSTLTLTGTLSTSLSALNVGPDITAVNLEARVMAGSFAMYSSGTKRVDGTPQTVNLPNLQGPEELLVATIDSAIGTQMITSRKAYAVAPTSIDASIGLIPFATDVQTTPTALTWTETGTGTADVVIASLDVTRGGSQIGTEYIRTIIAPHSGPSLTIPLLVGANAIYNPTTLDQIATSHGLAAGTGGYDSLRATAFTYTNIVEVAKMNGGVTLSYTGNNPPAF